MARAHPISLRPRPRTSRPRRFVELKTSFPSQIEAISPFLQRLMSFIARIRSLDGSETRIEMAVHEALANAVTHGNHGIPTNAFMSSAAAPRMEKSQSLSEIRDKVLTAAQYKIQLHRKSC